MGLYLENVLPSAAGVRKPLLFPFTKSFWLDTNSSNSENDSNKRNENNTLQSKLLDESDLESDKIRQSNFEDINDFLKRKQSNDQ